MTQKRESQSMIRLTSTERTMTLMVKLTLKRRRLATVILLLLLILVAAVVLVEILAGSDLGVLGQVIRTLLRLLS